MAPVKESTAKMLAFLAQPSSYPHHPASVVIRQTHASVVAIAPPFVYKVKKHVNLGFLDFTTLAARKIIDNKLELLEMEEEPYYSF